MKELAARSRYWKLKLVVEPLLRAPSMPPLSLLLDSLKACRTLKMPAGRLPWSRFLDRSSTSKLDLPEVTSSKQIKAPIYLEDIYI